MRCYAIALSILCVLGVASCGPNTTTSESTATAVGDSTKMDALAVKFVRIASVEHRYSNANNCTKKAKAYFQRVSKPGAPLPPPLLTKPLTYSFYDSTDKANRHEVRFRFQSAGTTQPTDTVINYWADKRANSSEQSADHYREELDKVIGELKKTDKCEEIQGAVEDSVPVNKKKAWRAIMRTTKPIKVSDEKLVTREISGKFGYIVNPPIP